jgi:hypothetical protein
MEGNIDACVQNALDGRILGDGDQGFYGTSRSDQSASASVHRRIAGKRPAATARESQRPRRDRGRLPSGALRAPRPAQNAIDHAASASGASAKLP